MDEPGRLRVWITRCACQCSRSRESAAGESAAFSIAASWRSGPAARKRAALTLQNAHPRSVKDGASWIWTPPTLRAEPRTLAPTLTAQQPTQPQVSGELDRIGGRDARAGGTREGGRGGKERGGGGFLLKKHASARTHNCADVNRRGRRRSGEDTLGKMDGPILRAGDAEILSGLERGMICRQLMPCLIISLLEIPDPSPSLA